MRLFLPLTGALLLVSCSSTPEQARKQPETARAVVTVKPTDESRRFPQQDLISSEVIDSHLLGKPFMPGGTIARYKKGKTEYAMFVARAANASAAAVTLGEWRSAISNPQFVASFGGYFGQDEQTPVFVFSKGEWLAGVIGLDREKADVAARQLAAGL
jgi:hypothetical protein